MCWSDAISGELCETFKKYMNTLISSILIHLLLVDYFLSHICLGPGFINHKCTVVPCVIVSIFDASLTYWRPWAQFTLFLSLFAERFASETWIILSHFFSLTDGNTMVSSVVRYLSWNENQFQCVTAAFWSVCLVICLWRRLEIISTFSSLETLWISTWNFYWNLDFIDQGECLWSFIKCGPNTCNGGDTWLHNKAKALHLFRMKRGGDVELHSVSCHYHWLIKKTSLSL